MNPFALLARLSIQTRFDVSATADARHALRPNEHEAFYFLFASEDGVVSGGVRTLFSAHDVLEIVGLKVGDEGWLLQRRTPLASLALEDMGGAGLRLRCVEPWRRWEAVLDEPLHNPLSGHLESVRFSLHFTATTPPALFRLGAYTQVQQDGTIEAELITAAGHWQGRLVSYRDHSWGQRGAGRLPGWMIIDIPQHLYAFILGTVDSHTLGVGRLVTPDGKLKPLKAPRVEHLDDGLWRISDPRAGVPAWTFTRLGPPGVSYLGPPGEEEIGGVPMDKALYRDIIGPARFTAPDGQLVVGFWDEAVRLSPQEKRSRGIEASSGDGKS